MMLAFQASRSLAVISLFASQLLSVSAEGCNPIQFDFPDGTNADSPRAEAVKQAYLDLWNDYEQYAFGNDTLLPISHSSLNDFYSWGLTIVDGIDTAIVMGLNDVVAKQLEHIAGVDFTTSPQLIGCFDAIIRYVGGLLSAYDLLTGDLVPEGTFNEEHVKALLTQATVLSNKLKPAFNNPSGLPAASMNFTTNQLENTNYTVNGTTYQSIVTAQAGTIILEWHRLSDLTGDNSFRELADKAEFVMINPVPATKYPGLVGTQMDVDTGNYLLLDSGWQSGIDSFYEYLIKSYIYNPSVQTAKPYLDFWETTVRSTLDNIALHPYGFDHLTFLSQLDDDGNLMWRMDDYSCFAGGNLLLGGKYLKRQEVIDLGIAVTDSCHQTYNTTASGLNPLKWAWYNGTNQAYNASAEDDPAARSFFEKSGYFIESGLWTGFPEPIESLMYAYRITGQTIWQDYSWEIFQKIQENTRRSPDIPFADLSDVNAPLGGELQDYAPSYYFAETLKYFYLTFSQPDLVSLDDYVFNTEGHPLRIQNKAC